MSITLNVLKLKKHYGSRPVITNLSLQLHQGDCYGLVGPNGSGKSTFIRILAGIDRADSGNVQKAGFGYVPQGTCLYGDLTGEENLEFFADLYHVTGRRRASSLTELVEQLELKCCLHKKVQHMSGGWQQRFSLACALIHQPPLLLLDEPTTGIDPLAKERIWELIGQLRKQRALSVLVTTHSVEEMLHCNRIGFMFLGSLVTEVNTESLVSADRHKHLEALYRSCMTRAKEDCYASSIG